MRAENKKMQEMLKIEGIKAKAKYIFEGSMRGTWRIYNKIDNWFGNKELQNKLAVLGFKDYNNQPLTDFSGNGGRFSIFVRNERFNIFLKGGG